MVASLTVSDATCQIHVETSLVKKYPCPNISRQEHPLRKHSLRKQPPINVITRLKCFWIKHTTRGPGEKSVSSIERRESGSKVVGVILVFLFSFLSIYLCTFCLYIDLHFVNIIIEKYFCLSIDVRFVNL